jgi:hypothetical protein
MQLFIPQSIEELMELLRKRQERYYFRGQANHEWVLNSTLARELRGQTTYLPRINIPKEPLETWGIREQLNYHKIILSRWEPTEELLERLSGKGDPYFEIIRHVQQEKLNPKIHNAISNHPTPAIEFSDSEMIALFFAADEVVGTDVDGAIFCLEKTIVSRDISFPFALTRMKLFGEITPCVIAPGREINDLGNPKPKRQEAIYVFQRDLRNPIDHYLQIEKIVINCAFKIEIKTWLSAQGITEEYVYALDQVRGDN